MADKYGVSCWYQIKSVVMVKVRFLIPWYKKHADTAPWQRALGPLFWSSITPILVSGRKLIKLWYYFHYFGPFCWYHRYSGMCHHFLPQRRLLPFKILFQRWLLDIVEMWEKISTVHLVCYDISFFQHNVEITTYLKKYWYCNLQPASVTFSDESKFIRVAR